MRSLKLNDVAYGLGIRVYCNCCGSWYDPREEMAKNRKYNCSHPAYKQRYKSTIIVPSIAGARRKRKSLVYESRDLQKVIKEGFSFKEHVKSQISVNKPKEEKPTLLIDCIAMFMDFKNDIGVQEHLKKNISRSSLCAFENYFKKWKEATDSIGEDFCSLQINKISNKNVSATIDFLSKFSNDTQKKAFGVYNQLYKYLTENGYNVTSPFKGIEVSDSPNRDSRSITSEEFIKIREAMFDGSSDDSVNGKVKYFPWLPDAMNFAALTGRRREEFMLAKFSDIRLVDGELKGGYILLLDGKYSRQNKHKIGFKPRYTKAPIFPELYDFLMKMGYERYKGSDRYIIAGDEVKMRVTLANNLTNAFGYYRDKVGLVNDVQLKGLRKGYITRMRNEFGDNANFFTGHKESRIDKKFYYDDRELFEKVNEFILWR
jgi:hypothetical protein